MKNRFDLHVHARKFCVCVDMRVHSPRHEETMRTRVYVCTRLSFDAHRAMRICARVFRVEQTDEQYMQDDTLSH